MLFFFNMLIYIDSIRKWEKLVYCLIVIIWAYNQIIFLLSILLDSLTNKHNLNYQHIKPRKWHAIKQNKHIFFLLSWIFLLRYHNLELINRGITIALIKSFHSQYLPVSNTLHDSTMSSLF